MQGIYIDSFRPKSKKAVKEAVESMDHMDIYIEATSVFGNEFAGSLIAMPSNSKVSFVGPDPYNDRKFYGTITKDNEGNVKVT